MKISNIEDYLSIDKYIRIFDLNVYGISMEIMNRNIPKLLYANNFVISIPYKFHLIQKHNNIQEMNVI